MPKMKPGKDQGNAALPKLGSPWTSKHSQDLLKYNAVVDHAAQPMSKRGPLDKHHPMKKYGPLTKPDEKTDINNETLVSSKTTKTRETTPEGIKGTRLTTESKFKTPGGTVKTTAEGDRAYAALSQEQKDAQDARFKAKQRSESQTRFTPDAITIPTTGVRSVTPEITVPDVNKKIYSKVFSPSENPNYDLRKKLYDTKRVKRSKDYRSGEITLEEARAQGESLRGMKETMYSPEEIKQRKQKRKVRKIKEAISSIIPKDNRNSYEKSLASGRRTVGAGNPCKSCN